MTNTEQLLSRAKITLGITSTAYDARLTQYLESAYAEIKREGVSTLDETNIEDSETIIMYGCWLWNGRNNGRAMPEMLRRRLNNRIFSEKMRNE